MESKSRSVVQLVECLPDMLTQSPGFGPLHCVNPGMVTTLPEG